PAGPLDPWDVLLAGPRSDVLRIGLAVPLSGPLAMTAPSALDLAGLAVDEANGAGGAGGRPVELVALDFGRAPDAVAAAAAVLPALGAEVVGEALVPFGPTDQGPLLDLVRRTRADAALLSLVGRDLVAFNREFARAGLDRRVVRLSGALEENGLYALSG